MMMMKKMMTLQNNLIMHFFKIYKMLNNLPKKRLNKTILTHFLYLITINKFNSNTYKFINSLNKNMVKSIKEKRCITFKTMIYVFYFIKIVINMKKKF